MPNDFNNYQPIHLTLISMIDIAIVEHGNGFRNDLAYIVEEEKRMRLSGSYIDILSTIQALQHSPDLFLLDGDIRDMALADAVALLNVHFPESRIVLFIVYEDKPAIFDALVAGADGYVLKSTDPTALVEKLLMVHGGGTTMTPRIARKSLRLLSREEFAVSGLPQHLYRLDRREHTLLRHLAQRVSTERNCSSSFC